MDAVSTTPGPSSARVRPLNAQVTALRLSKLLDPSPLPRAVPEAAAKRRSKPLMVLVPTTTRRFKESVTLAILTIAVNKSATAVAYHKFAPAQTIPPAASVPKARRVLALTAAEKAAITAQAIAAMILATTNQRGRQTHTSTEVILATILATILVTAATILVTTNQKRREIHTSTEVSPKILARSLKEARKNAEDQARELVIKTRITEKSNKYACPSSRKNFLQN